MVIDAAWRIITRDGMNAVSVRNVAAEANLAPSSLRYVFPSQTSLREQAIRAVLERLRARIAALPSEPDTRAWAREMLLELLPLDAERRLEMEVALVLGVEAVTDEHLRPLCAELYSEVHQVCATACAVMGVDDPVRVQELQAVIDGLALHAVLYVPGDAAWAGEVLDGHLERLGGQ